MRPDRGEAVAPAGERHSPETFGKEGEVPRERDESDGNDTASEFSEKQAGVKRIEAVSKSWTKTSLIIAYVTYAFPLFYCMLLEADWLRRLLIIANVTSLEIQVTSLVAPYATSAFLAHSLLSTIYVVQGIVSCKIHCLA